MNTASRMESTSLAMKIHISQSTKDLLGHSYKVLERGEIDVKGKGCMKTYWLEERGNRKPLAHITPPNIQEQEQMMAIAAGNSTGDRKMSILDTRRVSVPPNRELSAHSTATEDRRVYSPVTFQDVVARRSIANSPVKSIFSASRGRGKYLPTRCRRNSALSTMI